MRGIPKTLNPSQYFLIKGYRALGEDSDHSKAPSKYLCERYHKESKGSLTRRLRGVGVWGSGVYG